jgi:hypothetical protein
MHQQRRNRIIRSAVIGLGVVLLLLSIMLIVREGRQPAPAVVGKGSPLLEEVPFWEAEVDQAKARELALADEEVSSTLAGKDFGFLSALPLSDEESQRRLAAGCVDDTCARVSFYDYSEGGTVDAVLNLDTGRVLESSVHREARPGASLQVLPRALAIAAADERVAEVLGDVRTAEPIMGPMSGWLIDDDCREDWCVDLTYAAPDGSGRTFHVFVNMEREEVARLFYSRSRPERAYDRPAEEDRTWDNGCHEQYGWSVCWEMTANDGVEFREATYNGDPIFSSVKIGQIEVYYPSWPGGYRDEVGYAASVQPADGTHVTDLGDGFEVRQLFTEFLSWPNCVCCYRYEEIIRFYEDGTLDLHFISHGPGCDDPMIYRTFWRVDLDLDGQENEELLVWEGGEWVEAETEMELPLFESLSPDGEALITGGGKYRYIWLPRETDPFGNDEGRIFLLRWNEGEGEGEIVAGPPDSFQPPTQWLNDESLSNENIVVWYVSILKGTKSEPWWCAPEPAPDFSPCDAEMRIEPIVEPTPTATATTELTGTVEATTPGAASPTPTPTVEPTASATPTRPAELTRGPTPTPRPVAGETAEEIARVSGCDNCHLIGEIGEAGKVGPDLSSIGILAAQRVPGESATDYLRTSIVNPEAHLAPDCPNGPCLDGIMPVDYGERLTAGQIDTLVDFLLEQRAPTSLETGPDEAPQTTLSPVVLAAIIGVALLIVAVVVLVFLRLPGNGGKS